MDISKFFDRIWTKIVFKVGDIRRISHFPFITWDTTHCEMDYSEATEALRLIKPGDVGLSRHSLFLSNVFLPGCFKHAFFLFNSNTTIEAVSEGVLKRHSLYPVYTDYCIILRPKSLNDEELLKAIIKAENAVGREYDAHFAFDMEKYVKELEDKEAVRDHMTDYNYKFSCTELVSASYYHVKDKLRLYRKKYKCHNVIHADQFVNNGFEIIWCSNSMTAEKAIELGMHEEGVAMIQKYWESHKERGTYS